MLVPIAVRISALCGQARQLELKSDHETWRDAPPRYTETESGLRSPAACLFGRTRGLASKSVLLGLLLGGLWGF